MLTRLHLENFKAWEDTGDIELKPITGFFGTNSSGKSSLIQSLLLLKQTAESSDRGAAFDFGDSRAYADMGDFASVAHKHQVDRAMKISLDWDAGPPFSITDPVDGRPVARSRQLGFEVSSRAETAEPVHRAVVERMAYSVGDAVFGMRRTDDIRHHYEVFSENVHYEFVARSEIGYFPTQLPVKCYVFPHRARLRYLNAEFLSDLELALEKRLDRVYYLGPLRARSERTYRWPGSHPYDTGRSGEQAIGAILADAERLQVTQHKNMGGLSLEGYVTHWLKELDLIHDFRIERISEDSELYRVKVRKSPDGAEILIADVGFGVSQILPALVLCFYRSIGSTVILEQPEIHLHPLAQAGLADALIDARRNGGAQIIFESHSEHLLRRLQRRISEGAFPQDAVGLYFCWQDDGGVSHIDKLELDEFGNIANWPTNFFGDQFGEIAAMSEAAMKRRRGGE